MKYKNFEILTELEDSGEWTVLAISDSGSVMMTDRGFYTYIEILKRTMDRIDEVIE